ncbi:ribosomal protein L34-domain-containing protein [Tuber borchii]|uniref:Large ribosomal subunit protein bL34m n=1 Tax=Tuber borchii TaxID=42251 RepID=A0A2T6ZRG4_TUBBO|nr:ribosomal protein L34-domain-containing protein [Tuber borchii]
MFRTPSPFFLLHRSTQRPPCTPIPRLTRTIVTKITPLRPSTISFTPMGLTPPARAAVGGTGLGVTARLMPKISANPGLVGLQVRCGPRDTYNPSHRVRKRRLGFLARKRTPGGRGVLKRRRLKGRKSLTH